MHVVMADSRSSQLNQLHPRPSHAAVSFLLTAVSTHSVHSRFPTHLDRWRYLLYAAQPLACALLNILAQFSVVRVLAIATSPCGGGQQGQQD
jgi:hypothetical protein